MDRLADVEPGFEPQTRARSNTWPLPRPENYGGDEKAGPQESPFGEAGAPKKNSSRRNAWGNMSYADLITQAIQSAPEKRLTLSQIYEWMVQNVPYFKDKGDSNSSAGWKRPDGHDDLLRRSQLGRRGSFHAPPLSLARPLLLRPSGRFRCHVTFVHVTARRLRPKGVTLAHACSRAAVGMATRPSGAMPTRVIETLTPAWVVVPSQNSIRHNLSLHSRFMRVQNEGAGKSSWWMLNPDAKPGKAARRRATSMETPRYEKKRGRLKKKLEALRASPSPSSSEGPLDPFPESPPASRLDLQHCSPLAPLPGSPSAWPPQQLMPVDRYGAGPLADTLTQSMTLGDRHDTAPPPPMGPSASQVMGRLLTFNDHLPHDLDLDLDAVPGLHCDVDQVIQHELSVDGNLDFNFDTHARPWVH
ncbi:hypothetical protein HPB50_001225 [Hyalomma asiaticum]|uniref:Uncharacterized protein n=1 Tax=Hyalomma asiaticum TaxID=266040 RepID=A0ACB7S397_HYAAI|nr:hypothetical protein HPB50_001225 [Hyalomma asiaticum]